MVKFLTFQVRVNAIMFMVDLIMISECNVSITSKSKRLSIKES